VAGRKKQTELTYEQKLELVKQFKDGMKALGSGLIEFCKSGPIPRYTVTSLLLLYLGKKCVISPAVCGTLQGLNTALAFHEVIDESGGSLLGLDEMSQSVAAATGGATIGLVWAAEAVQCPKMQAYGGVTEGDFLTNERTKHLVEVVREGGGLDAVKKGEMTIEEFEIAYMMLMVDHTFAVRAKGMYPDSEMLAVLGRLP
jgi:hypothetical protein